MTHDDHTSPDADPAAVSGFEQLLDAADETRTAGDTQTGAVFFRPAASRPTTHRPGVTSGGTHRAAPRRAPRLPGSRAAGWATSARAVGVATAAGAVLLLASVGSGAVDLTGASSDSVLAAVAPGVASALGIQPDQQDDPQPDQSSGQAITTWSRAQPSSSGNPAAPSTSPAAEGRGDDTAPNAAPGSVADAPAVREPQAAKAPVPESVVPAVESTPAAETTDAPVVVPDITEPATTSEVPVPTVTEPAVTTAPEVTTPEVTTPTTPEVTTPEVTTPEVTTPTTPEVTTPGATTESTAVGADTGGDAGEAPSTPTTATAAAVSEPSTGNSGLLVALTLGGVGLGTAGRHAVRRGRHRADRATARR